MSLSEFNPNFKSPHVAPECGNDGATDFPMEEIMRRMDGERDEQTSERFDSAAAIRELMEWVVCIKANDNRGLSPIATRTLACVWVMNPELVGGCAGHMVAKAYGISYQKFSRHAADFSRTFGIQNRYQAHNARNNRKHANFECNGAPQTN
jgi:hypothetical protein